MERIKLTTIEELRRHDAPVFLAIDDANDHEHMLRVCRDEGVELSGALDIQLDEMREVQMMHHRLETREFAKLVADTIERAPGVRGEYVFFPWGAPEIVNILPQPYFYENLAWRNKLKLNADEQARIAAVHVGVMGNSVGSFAAKLVAKMGVCRLSLAESKTMRPSNTTRVYADSVREYGKHKTRGLARSIYEFNPYAQLRIFETGLDTTNIDEFLRPRNGPQLDIVIDAADDGESKVRLRNKCREHRIARVAGYDERGIFIVERFDLDPAGDVLTIHVTEEQMREYKAHSPSEYVAGLLEFFPGGWDALSQRQRDTADAMQAGRCGGYAQLAWEAGLFGATVAKGVVDIATGRPLAGHWTIDLDQILDEPERRA